MEVTATSAWQRHISPEFAHRALVRRRTTATRGREVAFAACVVLVLSLGVVGVLLLNTAMQQQSDRMVLQRQRIAALQQRLENLRQTVDRRSDPARLAAKARALDLRPVKRIEFVSARPRADRRAHAG